MRTYLDCYSCLVRQAVDASRRASDDPVVQERIVRQVLGTLATADLSLPPPVHARVTNRIVKQHTGVTDPYLEDKRLSNELALRLVPACRERIAEADDPLATAVRLAAAGNIIDFGVHGDVDPVHVEATIEHALDAPLDPHTLARFRQETAAATRILYLADNAGELAFDRLLIEQFAPGTVTVAVKSAPVLNDALRADAEAVGIHEVAEVMENGAGIPGTWLEETSAEFRALFLAADVVISKGQGNYETLSGAPREVFYILKVKCPMVSRHLGEPIGTIILRAGSEDATWQHPAPRARC
jgi:uncharacterized protein with ATP-grasp and redox domains